MVICVGEILADMIAQPSDGILTYGRYAGGDHSMWLAG